MTELISAEKILKHLSYSNLEVTYFAEYSKNVFTLKYNLPYNGPKVNDIVFKHTSYELEIGSLGLSFIQHENSHNPMRSNKGYYCIPGWETTITWDSMIGESSGPLFDKVRELGYSWINQKIGSL